MTLLRAFGPMVAYMAIIFALSAQSKPPIPMDLPDVLLHVPEYVVLGLLVIWALRTGVPSVGAAWVALLAITFCVLYGASDEWHQSFVPGREESLHDLASDAVGGATAVVVWRVALWVRGDPKRKAPRPAPIGR